jgi:hypothetical protein
VRQVKRTLAQACLIAPTGRAGFGDMPNRIGLGIAVGGRILGSADTDGIEHDEKSARHQRKSFKPRES